MSTETQDSVADLVRAELARRRLKQTDLAAHLCLTRSAISRRLTGEMEFSITELRTTAAFFGVPLATFLPELAEEAS